MNKKTPSGQGLCGVVVSQLGARMHYAVPQIFERRGLLAHFYTDVCGSQGWPSLLRHLPRRALPSAVRRLTARVPQGIAPERMTTFPSFGFEWAAWRLMERSPLDHMRNAVWAGSGFSRRVARAGFHGAAGLYTFSGDGLEQIRAARARGMWSVVEQMIAPRDTVERFAKEEAERFPDWHEAYVDNPHARIFADRERAEWALADLIICPSEFVRRHVIAEGVAPERCVLVPYGVGTRFQADRRERAPGPLRVLTVGQVGLRKGSPYVLEAARQLAGRAEFRLVGPIGAPAAALAPYKDVATITGPIPRDAMAEEFARADVFLLPSLCEGSATAVYEAMMAGLPVICTENTGSVVRHGVDGFIVPIRDAAAIVGAVETLAADPALLAKMSESARNHGLSHSVERYGERLIEALSGLLGRRQAAGPPLRRDHAA